MTEIVSVRPVVLPAPERGGDLQLRVTAPMTEERLPVVLFSHGYGSNLNAYGPLVDHWAANGLVVVQPTHLDSATLALPPDDPRQPEIWRFRIANLVRVLDELDTVLAVVPGLAERADTGRIAVAGHSYGATTASALLGARVLAPAGDPSEDFTDSRVAAGVLLCLAGLAGDNVTPLGEHFPFMNPDFDHLAARALFVAGDADQSLLSTRGPDWWTDAYRLSPGPKSLLTVSGAEHGLGGITDYPAFPPAPGTDAAAVRLVRQVTTAYLRSALGVDDANWPVEVDAGIGHLESRSNPVEAI